jgi:4a-hydroxytetrahydrobiopterin dehydratase
MAHHDNKTEITQIFNLTMAENCQNYFVELKMEKLAGEARAQALIGLDGWAEVDGRDAICKTFQFGDFKQAFAFMTQSALAAEQADHHPEWFNVYNRVDVTLATHDAGGLTQRDIDLATLMDGFAK